MSKSVEFRHQTIQQINAAIEAFIVETLRRNPETKITDWELCYAPDLNSFSGQRIWLQLKVKTDSSAR